MSLSPGTGRDFSHYAPFRTRSARSFNLNGQKLNRRHAVKKKIK